MLNGFSTALRVGLYTLPLAFFAAALPVTAAPGCNNGAEVTITIGNKLTVLPKRVEIFVDTTGGGHGRVCWTVVGLAEDMTVHLTGKPGSDDSLLPNRERTINLPRTFANSGRPARDGTWGYTVWVTRGGEKILQVDPEVIIKKKGGGG